MGKSVCLLVHLNSKSESICWAIQSDESLKKTMDQGRQVTMMWDTRQQLERKPQTVIDDPDIGKWLV